MTTEASEPPSTVRPGVYYGWVNLVVAAAAMSATLPGRSHGLSLIVEPMLADFGMTGDEFARLNVFAALIGAAFCLPVGVLIDRAGVRVAVTAVLLGLSASTAAMAAVSTPAGLAATTTLVRGFGQSALSVVSLAIVGHWFRRRLGVAMGLFSVLINFGFIGGVLAVGAAVEDYSWRTVWRGVAAVVGALAILAWIFTRRRPEEAEFAAYEGDAKPSADLPDGDAGMTLLAALGTARFWVFALGVATFNLVWSAITLFNEAILAERQFDQGLAVQVMAVLTGSGLIANLIAGALVRRVGVGMLLGVALGVFAAALAAFPLVDSPNELFAYATAIGTAGGGVTVVFFAAWARLFGRRRLGRIQGAAQVVAVFASALGPVLLTQVQLSAGSFSPFFRGMAAASAVTAIAAFASARSESTA